MTEDVKIELPDGAEETEAIEEGSSNEVQLSPMESNAAERGWKPKDQWVADGGDPDEWRSAREFLDRGELLKQIHKQNQKVKQIEQTFGALKQHHGAVYEKAYKDALAALKKERREALVDGDVERVEEIEDKIEATQEEFQTKKEQFKAETAVDAPNPTFVTWVENNPWYESNEDLREFADVLGIAYARKNPGIDPVKVLAHVEKEVKKKFPEEVGIRKAAPNPVQGVKKTASAKSNGTDGYQLSETEEAIMKNFVRTGVMTKAQYIAELKKINERN